jgi:hypothetical protein
MPPTPIDIEALFRVTRAIRKHSTGAWSGPLCRAKTIDDAMDALPDLLETLETELEYDEDYWDHRNEALERALLREIDPYRRELTRKGDD